MLEYKQYPEYKKIKILGVVRVSRVLNPEILQRSSKYSTLTSSTSQHNTLKYCEYYCTSQYKILKYSEYRKY